MAQRERSRDAVRVHGDRVIVCAVEVATQLAVLAEARLALVGFAPLPLGDPPAGVPAWTLDEARRALELTAASLEGRVGVDCYLDAGNPVRALVELALRTHALLLVVGTTAPAADVPASIVATALARNAPCPVVVVPEAAPVPALQLGG
jgi:nucleotide-binding universal stress UspA family protein